MGILMQHDELRRDLRWKHREIPNPYPMNCGWCEEEIENDEGGEWVTRYQTTLCNDCLRELRGVE